MNIVYKLSPFGGGRQSPDRIVIHAMAEFIEGGNDGSDDDIPAEELLLKLGLSAHSLVTPSGENIRTREDNQIAYHAKGFNTDSLGIEFLVKGTHTYGSFLKAIDKEGWLTKDQFDSGVRQVTSWINKFNIKSIDRHSDLSPGRKFDPGNGFPWETFLEAVNEF